MALILRLICFLLALDVELFNSSQIAITALRPQRMPEELIDYIETTALDAALQAKFRHGRWE